MLVAAEGLPDKRTGAPTSLKVILTTGNAELRPTTMRLRTQLSAIFA